MQNPYDKIVELLNKNSMTANGLAVKLGINNTLFSQWKQGKSKPSLEVLVKIADYFNVALDYLIDRETQNATIHNNGNSNINLATAGNHNSFFADKPPLTEFETQLLKTYNSLTTTKKMELLTFALKLENKED